MSKSLSSPFKLHEQLVQVVAVSKQSFVMMGRLLSELKNKETYKKAVGDGIDTWPTYLAQPEIGLSKGEAGRLIQIYEEFILRLEFKEEFIASIPIKNIHYLLPLVKKDDTLDVLPLLEDAQQLSQSDFKERLYDIQSDGSQERTYTYLIMKKCMETHTMSKVPDISSELIANTFGLE